MRPHPDRYNVWITNTDQVLTNVHDPSRCAGRPCAIHKQSKHHMRSWPQRYSPIGMYMERICPCPLPHPDPDEAAFMAHDCPCGCCSDPEAVAAAFEEYRTELLETYEELPKEAHSG